MAVKHTTFGTTFYEGTGSKDIALQNAIEKDHKFMVSWQCNEKNYWYGSYINRNIFVNNLIKVPKKDRKFYEVLTGFCNTYADLEWYDLGIFEEDVIRNFTKIFVKVFDLFDAEISKSRFNWSISSNDVKKSLHFNYVGRKCWKNVKDQNLFWKHFKKCLYAIIMNFITRKQI